MSCTVGIAYTRQPGLAVASKWRLRQSSPPGAIAGDRQPGGQLYARRQVSVCWRLRASPDKRQFEEFRATEDDQRYRRVDYSAVHAYEARQAFLQAISRGEAAIDLAEAALQIAAEDDALVSHSSVQLPVASYQQRLHRMAVDLSRRLPTAAGGSSSSSTSGSGGGSGSEGSTAGGTGQAAAQRALAEEQLQAIQRFLYEELRYSVPQYGRSNLPVRAVVDHPGVWESASHAYLNEVLVRRRGIPAVLAILLQDLVRRLLLMGAIDFAVRVDTRGMSAPPLAEVLPLTRDMVVQADGTVLNTCTTDALAEVLRFLKRCYWPWAWDSAAGGFRAAASVFLEGEEDAAMQAISRTARHRLERGIWTSPGAGDIRRAVAACERLVVLCGEHCPLERRDLAVLYMHLGRFKEAKAELLHFSASSSSAAAGLGAAGLPLPPAATFSLTPMGAMVAAGGQPLQDQVLTDRLLQLLSGVKAAPGPLTLESALSQPPPQQLDDAANRLPLTW